MECYLVFAITAFPDGGMDDCVGRYEDIKEARDMLLAIRNNHCDNYIYDVIHDKRLTLEDFQHSCELIIF